MYQFKLDHYSFPPISLLVKLFLQLKEINIHLFSSTTATKIRTTFLFTIYCPSNFISKYKELLCFLLLKLKIHLFFICNHGIFVIIRNREQIILNTISIYWNTVLFVKLMQSKYKHNTNRTTLQKSFGKFRMCTKIFLDYSYVHIRIQVLSRFNDRDLTDYHNMQKSGIIVQKLLFFNFRKMI